MADHIINPASLAAKLAAPQDQPAQALRSILPAKVRKKLFPADAADLGPGISQALARALNKLAQGPSLYDPERFPDKILSPETLELKDQALSGKKLAQFNRLLLRDAFPEEISTEPKTETVWLATSREAEKLGTEDFLATNRQYWGIENGDHQRLDCSALEDPLRVRNPNAATVLGLFHRFIITLFVAWAKKQPNQRDRTYPTWQSIHDGNRWRIIHQVVEPPSYTRPSPRSRRPPLPIFLDVESSCLLDRIRPKTPTL